MKGGNYSMKTSSDLSSKSSIERERLREREREARAQMTYEADQRVSQDVINSGGPLFGAIIRANPKSNDKERQQIERKLGKFEDVKHLLADQDATNLFGVDGQPPPSPAPSTASTSSHEFKKPNACPQTHPAKSHHHHHHHHHSSSQRNSLTKPTDGKTTYGNRNSFYNTKHNMNSNEFRNNGTMSKNFAMNGISGTTGVSTSGYIGSNKSSANHEHANKLQSPRNLPKLNCELREPLHSLNSTDGGLASQTNVENILDEMTSGVRTPLTAIAATPRKEMESKFTFNPVSGKMESLLPLTRTSTDKNKINPLNSILGPPGRGAPFMSSSAFRHNEMTPLTPFSPPAAAVNTSNTKNLHHNLSNEANGDSTSKSSSGTEKMDSTLPTLRSDLSLSEDTDDGGDNDEDDEDDRTNNDKEKDKAISMNTYGGVKNETSNSPNADSARKCDQNKDARTSSSDDTDTDSGSESEDSSSDSSPSQQPLAKVAEQKELQSWHLENFLPPSALGNTLGHNSMDYQNRKKTKPEDSDSSASSPRKAQIASCSTSDSENEKINLRSDKRKRSRASTSKYADNANTASRVNTAGRRKHRRARSYSQSSEDESDRRSSFANSNGYDKHNINGNTSFASNASASPSHAVNCNPYGIGMNATASIPSNGTGSNSSNGGTVVGVVRPHPRKPPSPQIFHAAVRNDGYGYAQQSHPQAPEPQCELPPSTENDTVLGNVNRNLLADHYRPQQNQNHRIGKIGAIKNEKSASQAKPNKPGRKPKSPAVASSSESPVKKKRGRKRNVKVQDLSDSEDEGPKKVPEKKRPGRPPLKRNDADDVDWNANSRRKPLDKFQTANVWCDRERRRSSLRMSSFTTADSESETEILTATVKPTARVIPAVNRRDNIFRSNRDSSCESTKNDSDFNAISETVKNTCIAKAEESPPKLDVEGIAVQDKKKSDTLRKLFSRREEGGGKAGGKGKGGKGKCGVIVMESEMERKLLERSTMPSLQRKDDDRFVEMPIMSIDSLTSSSSTSTSKTSDKVSPELPKLSYNNGRPSLMCKIDLSRIPCLSTKKRSEEVRIKTELPDTRQNDTNVLPPNVNVPMIEPLHSDAASIKNPAKKLKNVKRKRYAAEETNVPIFPSTVHTPSVDTDIDTASSDSDNRKTASLCPNGKKRTNQTDSVHNLIPACFPMNVNNMPQQNICVEQTSAGESWKSSESSCSDCSELSSPCHDKYPNMVKRSSQHRNTKRKKKLRNDRSVQRHSNLTDCAPNVLHLANSTHERSLTDTTVNGYHQMAISDLVVRPSVPTHHGIYYSYLEHKASEEINSESDNVSPNLYLMEAKRLKHAADTERDLVAQGMQYLEAILSFVLTGHVLERKNQMDTAFNMYSETLKLIVYISKKFRTLCTNVTQSSIPNKIAILSLRCESILNLKLYMMREVEVKDVHNAVAEYFNKPPTVESCLITNPGIPSPHSPTPSPASSIGSNSSGYSSGDRRSVGVSQCVAVPLTLHNTLQKQHNFYSNLISSFSYWEEADKLIFSGGNKDFFIELDRFCGPLTLHSSLKDLVHYVRVGIQRLKAIISHNHGV